MDRDYETLFALAHAASRRLRDATGRLPRSAGRGEGACRATLCRRRSADSPFALRGEHNSALGAVRSTSIYLREDGGAGTVQQIDLVV